VRHALTGLGTSGAATCRPFGEVLPFRVFRGYSFTSVAANIRLVVGRQIMELSRMLKRLKLDYVI